jgi:hypothetical protein
MKALVYVRRIPAIFLLLLAAVVMTGCSSMYPVTFKVVSEPEGGHVLYKLDVDEPDGPAEWVYLGSTPLNAVKMIDGWDISSENKVTLKIFRNGYVDQIREWNAESFWEENDEKGLIFWSPRMVPSNQ